MGETLLNSRVSIILSLPSSLAVSYYFFHFFIPLSPLFTFPTVFFFNLASLFYFYSLAVIPFPCYSLLPLLFMAFNSFFTFIHDFYTLFYLSKFPLSLPIPFLLTQPQFFILCIPFTLFSHPVSYSSSLCHSFYSLSSPLVLQLLYTPI